ncbi:MAG: dockerin type I repeat-containing protein, partial [Candidatus Zixiibacteriota bacterium]
QRILDWLNTPWIYVYGDANFDQTVDVGDVVYLTNYLYKGGSAPVPPAAGDANGDCTIDVGDVVYLVNYLFKGGPPPVEGCG